MDVLIRGAGPSGLLTALRLLQAGYEVTIYDIKKEIGRPQHCSGIVSGRFIEHVKVPNKLVVNRVRKLRLKIGDWSTEVSSTVPKAFVIDRYGYEVWLFNKVNDLGGRVILSSTEPYTEEALGDIIINATGPSTYLKNGGLVLKGFQYIVENECYEDTIEIEINKSLNNEFFFWISPSGKGRVKIGTASSESPQKKLNMFTMDRGLDSKKLSNILSGLVVVGGPLREFYVNGEVLIGDSAGQVKPTTGGGLLLHSYASDIFVKLLKEGKLEYSHEFYKTFGRELRIQSIIRDIFISVNQSEIVELFEVLSRKEFFNVAMSLGDMDFHGSTLLKLFSDLSLLSILVKILGKRASHKLRGLI